LLSVSSWAQNGATIVFPNRPPELLELLDRGWQMELRQRWGEALSHYEDALRLFPEDRSLQRRFAVARAHYDLARRYADESFRRSVEQFSAAQALDLYAQVLLKIQTHYVDSIEWKALVDWGTANLEIALGAPVFLQRNVPDARRGAIDGFRAELRRTMAGLAVANRADARQAAAVAAQLAQEQLAIAPAAVVFEYLCGAANALDQYSAYLTPDQLNEVYAQIEGNFVGLGVELKAHNSALRIVRVIPGSPAEQAGIRTGDLIVAVDGRQLQPLSTEEAANLLRGEQGTLVSISVVTPGQQPREVIIRRRRVEVPSIDQASIIDPQHGIAYLRLVCFQKGTGRDLDAALWR
jgi:carboxyl-terminal processing protease